MRGIGFSPLFVSVELHWDKRGTKHNDDVVFEEEVSKAKPRICFDI